MDISVTIASGSSASMLQECVKSLCATRGDLALEIIVVDNCASFDVKETLAGHPVTILTNDTQLGLAANQNRAIAVAQGDFIFWLNDDTLVQPDCLQSMLQAMRANPKVGAIAPKLWNERELLTPQANIASNFPTPWRCFLQDLLEETPMINWPLARKFIMSNFYPLTRTGPVPSLGGAAIFFRREALDQVGPMDESYGMYYEETDWCYRLKLRGWQLFGVAEAQVVHFGGQTTRTRADFYSEMQRKSRLRYLQKFHPKLTCVLMERLLPLVRQVLRRFRGGSQA